MLYKKIMILSIFLSICAPIECMMLTCYKADKQNVNDVDQYRKTRLYKAITEFGSLDQIEELLKVGADPNCGYSGSLMSLRGSITPLHAELSNKKPRLACISLLLKYKGDPNKFDSLLCYKVDLHSTDTRGNTPLHTAARVVNKPEMSDIVAELFKYGANVELLNHCGNTVFHVAAEINNISVCSRLVELLEQRQKIVETLLLVHKKKG